MSVCLPASRVRRLAPFVNDAARLVDVGRPAVLEPHIRPAVEEPARCREVAGDGAAALLVLTEWNEFRRPDFNRMKQMLKNPVIFDGRNIYDPADLIRLGFKYFPIGRKHG